MFTPMTIEDQAARMRDDDLRVIVVGAGMAGLTAAGLLRRQGRHPVLVERSPDGGHPGYMLALMPMVDRALDDLGVREAYRARSVPFDRYGVHDRHGRLTRMDSVGALVARYGDYRGIARGELVETLTANGCPVTFSTTVTAIDQGSDNAVVTLKTAGRTVRLEADLVVVADGIHSTTRSLVLGDRPVAEVDTTWGGWVVWADEDADMDLGEELWGAGFFLGVYPVKGALGVFLGGPAADTRAGVAEFVARVRGELTTTSPRFRSVLEALLSDPDPYYWPLVDRRAPEWVLGRTVLIGDAAAGFLPTAGIGAGMAMESAWMLASLLRHARPDALDTLLRAYETIQRPRVEAAQDNSRSLANLMFHRSRALAIFRDLAMRVVSVKVALGPIQRILASQPDPDAVAASALGEGTPIPR